MKHLFLTTAILLGTLLSQAKANCPELGIDTVVKMFHEEVSPPPQWKVETEGVAPQYAMWYPYNYTQNSLLSVVYFKYEVKAKQIDEKKCEYSLWGQNKFVFNKIEGSGKYEEVEPMHFSSFYLIKTNEDKKDSKD